VTRSGCAGHPCVRRASRAAARLVGAYLGERGCLARGRTLALRGARARRPTWSRAGDGRWCDRAFTRITAAGIGSDGPRVACGEAQFRSRAAAPPGANLDALADACAAVQVADGAALPAYAVCLARSHDCEIATRCGPACAVDDLLALVGHGLASRSVRSRTDGDPTPLRRRPRPPRSDATPSGEDRDPDPDDDPTLSAMRRRGRRDAGLRNGIVEDGEECDGLDLDDNGCDDLCDEPDPPHAGVPPQLYVRLPRAVAAPIAPLEQPAFRRWRTGARGGIGASR